MHQVAIFLAALAPLAQDAKPRSPRTLKVHPAAVTPLMASDAALSGGLKEMYPGSAWKRFWVQNWKSPNDSFSWSLDVDKEEDYAITMLIRDETRKGDLCEVEFSAGEKRLKHVVKRVPYWDRQTLDGTIRLAAGRSALSLRALKLPPKARLSLFSIELVPAGAKREIEASVQSLRSSTEWMVQARYGVMYHWTARTKPRHGPAKPYARAVADFDVESFARMVQRTGAGFVVMTTSWADYYFPAPIAAIDEIVQGRTAPRDLVLDLADALGKRGIKLMLYYHPGHDDAPWWSKLGYDDREDKTRFFDIWCRVISSIGERYGEKLAGWWFDDGLMCYYPYDAPWEKMTRAAKAGNPKRVVGYNAWICPRTTDYQDFSCGEGDFTEFIGKDFLPRGGSGRFIAGPQAGLQAALTWMLEAGNWCHLDPDKEIPPPCYTKDRLIGLFKACVSRRIVPMINMEAYQDGTTGPASVEALEAVSEALRALKEKPEEIQEDVAAGLLPQPGDIALESFEGKIQGSYLTYVENVDCITCWTNPKGAVKWSFVAPETGRYRVYATLIHGRGPSEYLVRVGEGSFTGRIAGIGADPGWSDYRDESLGAIQLEKGRTYEASITVTLMPAKGSPMNFRRLLLRPEKAGR
jgi:hypothetical protein